MGRVHRGQPGRLRYSRFCDLYRAFGKHAVGDDAADPRWAASELFVDYAGDTVPVIIDRLDRRDPAGADLRRGDGRVELHLRLGDLDRDAAGLDRRPRAGLRAIGGVPELIVPDNPKIAIDQGLLLRARGQPHLRRDGGPLRNRDAAGAAPAAARQGQGRAAVLHRRAMAAGQAAQADASTAWPTSTPRIGELWSSSTSSAPMRQARRHPPPAVRGDRPPGAEALPAEPYEYSRVARAPGRRRLSRRHRRALSTPSPTASPAPRSRCALTPAASRSS